MAASAPTSIERRIVTVTAVSAAFCDRSASGTHEPGAGVLFVLSRLHCIGETARGWPLL
jgi:hypothetical protein